MDLAYDGDDNNELTTKELIASNLAVMHRQMVSNAKNPTLFFGRAYRAVIASNARPVRIRVQDCLDHKKLGYIYQHVDIPWLNFRPNSSKIKQDKLLSVTKKRKVSTSGIALPRILDSTIRTRVARPQRLRGQKQKANEEEVLTIKLELSRKDKFIKFDVYINEEDDLPKRMSRMNAEYAGCFVSLPHRQHKTKDHNKKTYLTLGLTDLIEDQGVDDNDIIHVLLVPTAGSDAVVITDVKIDFIS